MYDRLLKALIISWINKAILSYISPHRAYKPQDTGVSKVRHAKLSLRSQISVRNALLLEKEIHFDLIYRKGKWLETVMGFTEILFFPHTKLAYYLIDYMYLISEITNISKTTFSYYLYLF